MILQSSFAWFWKEDIGNYCIFYYVTEDEISKITEFQSIPRNKLTSMLQFDLIQCQKYSAFATNSLHCFKENGYWQQYGVFSFS